METINVGCDVKIQHKKKKKKHKHIKEDDHRSRNKSPGHSPGKIQTQRNEFLVDESLKTDKNTKEDENYNTDLQCSSLPSSFCEVTKNKLDLPLLREIKIKSEILSEISTEESDFSYVDDTDTDEIFDDIDTEEMSESIQEQLKNLIITLPFAVPESHCIERHLTRTPTEHEREQLAGLGVQLETKRFNPEEDAIIRRNWERFSKEYMFDDPAPFMSLHVKGIPCMPASERRHLIQFIGHGLPNRTLYSIYGRFRTLYRGCIKGTFTAKEDKLILKAVEERRMKNAFSFLAKRLNRERMSIHKRYLAIRSESYYKEHEVSAPKVAWTLQRAGMVLRRLLKVTGLRKIKHLRNRYISPQEWKEVERKCKIKARSIKQFWLVKLSTQLFSMEPVNLNEVRIKLIKRFYKDRVKWWQDINWKEVSMDFHGISPHFLHLFFRLYLKRCFPNINTDYLNNNFQEPNTTPEFDEDIRT
ncbi:uncharacterized protein [Periplaneta americana]|uniref:uncharacterized protein isoform X2 n=1 Tax=Periplaneta americana TaxID=6978 RepID=UPI0037E732B5